ncbi:MAG: hypothetical protein ACFFCT_13185, partial [Candidatus Odinarchaeota archaeon]
MKVSHAKLFAFFLCTILILPICLKTQNLSLALVDNPQMSDVEMLLPLANPDLNSEPDVIINGDSGEFSSTYHEGVEDSYISLNWIHTPGYRPTLHTNEYGVPDTEDFIFVSQDFEYDYTQRPEYVNISMRYLLESSGNFSIDDNERYMMQGLYLFFIDSSGNKIGVSERIYKDSSEFHDYNAHLNIPLTMEIFDGEDEFTVAFGLAPTPTFIGSESSGPWLTYEGSVNLTVTSMRVEIYEHIEPHPDYTMEHIANGTWTPQASDVGIAPEDFDAGYSFRDLAVSNTDSIFTVGYCSQYHGFGDPTNFYFQTLQRWDGYCQIIWSRAFLNWSNAVALDARDGYVWVVGTEYNSNPNSSISVTKWDEQGNMLWDSSWYSGWSDMGIDISCDSLGNSYVLTASSLYMSTTVYENYSLLKFSSDGELTWQKSLPYTGVGAILQIEISPDDTLYISNQNEIARFDLDGNQVWTN